MSRSDKDSVGVTHEIGNHGNQLTWYNRTEFHIHPSFYPHHDKQNNQSEIKYSNLDISVFANNKNDLMPNVLPSHK
jgi:hypothetical protein